MSFAPPLPGISPSPWGPMGLGQVSRALPLLQNSRSIVNERPVIKPGKVSIPIDYKKLFTAIGFLGIALLLKGLPKQGLSNPTLLSADWKDYAKIVLGVLATSQLNKALNLNPKPWQVGLETSALIHPLVVNWSNSFFGRFIPLGLVVPAVIEAGSRLNEWASHKAEKRWGVPHWASGLGVSVVMMGVGMVLYPVVFKLLGRSGILGKTIRHEASHPGWTLSTMLVCMRGCCQGSVVCLTELGEFLGGFANWWRGNAKNHTHQASQEQTG